MDIFGSTATATALVASAATVAQNTFTNGWGVVALAVGLPIAFYILARFLGLLPGRRARY